MKKLCVLLIAFLCLVGCGKKDDNVDSQTISLAKEYAQAMIDKNYDKLIQDFEYDDEMKKIINANQLIPSLQIGMESLGQMKEQKEPFSLTSGDKTAIHIPTQFENQNVNITISFDKDNKIIGVFFNEYSEKN